MKFNKYWLLSFLITMTSVFVSVYAYNEYTGNFSCASEIFIKRDVRNLNGLVNYKVSPSSGIVNIKGVVNVSGAVEYAIDRTIIFSAQSYGNSPVWKSEDISISKLDTAPNNILNGLLPDVYLNTSMIADVEFKKINFKTIAITKGDVPFLFCTRE